MITKTTPRSLSKIQTISKQEYILIEWRTRGYERERLYTLHLIDVEASLISENPMLEFYLPFEQKRRYAPYFYSFMPLLVYAISIGMFLSSKKKKIKVTFPVLDRIFKRIINDYNNGKFDGQSIVAPELGEIIRGRIKDE